ncbi:GyrI-like domain-containing protein [Bradyrhizobium sp. AUGA SZCCT0182]|uniref:AraC family transcriptional regulator n=1 Tax=Bradyrhizobium sp. AUGA SZCCT0182 TaxID=2807667 RepID=UPI001BA7A0B4|nr:GyrI-like domain-containing protein [Bradyrhizobium sp. AUGA SZCCT0182]MBR1236915.1 AraC family transcriptional regulator [Bradyrhizobium sp. AUGA SZCCT0182]
MLPDAGADVTEKLRMKTPASLREYERRINRVIDHVQAHLVGDLTLERLADIAAFSPFHFHRVFTSITGETLADFIRRTRLERAAAALLRAPDANVFGIALEYGFSSAATFARAFKAHFGMSATRWRGDEGRKWREVHRRRNKQAKPKRKPGQSQRKNRKASIERIRHRPATGTEGSAMRVKVMEIPPYRIAYMRHVGPYGTSGGISPLWARLMRWAAIRELRHPAMLTVGIGHDAPSIVAPDRLRYDAGLIVGNDFKPDRAINVADLPGGKYAVMLFQGSAAVITEAWDRLYTIWLPGSGYQPEDRPRLELRRGYDFSTASLRCELCLPIRPL